MLDFIDNDTKIFYSKRPENMTNTLWLLQRHHASHVACCNNRACLCTFEQCLLLKFCHCLYLSIVFSRTKTNL